MLRELSGVAGDHLFTHCRAYFPGHYAPAPPPTFPFSISPSLFASDARCKGVISSSEVARKIASQQVCPITTRPWSRLFPDSLRGLPSPDVRRKISPASRQPADEETNNYRRFGFTRLPENAVLDGMNANQIREFLMVSSAILGCMCASEAEPLKRERGKMRYNVRGRHCNTYHLFSVLRRGFCVLSSLTYVVLHLFAFFRTMCLRTSHGSNVRNTAVQMLGAGGHVYYAEGGTLGDGEMSGACGYAVWACG